MNFDDDSMIGRLLQRWVFMAQAAAVIFIIYVALVTIVQFPSYVIRWYQTDEPKESNFFGWMCFSKMMGIYAFVLFVCDLVFNEYIDPYWPTVFSLFLDDGGFGQPLHGLSVWSDCLLFAAIAWCVRKYCNRLGFLEADPETGMAIFYPGFYQ